MIPLSGVSVTQVSSAKGIGHPVLNGDNYQVSGNEFALQVNGVGSFYTREGIIVEYCPDQNADHEWLKLYLNGQILVALLHQRKIINFHASSFIYNGLGIMILGETGAGKSSLTLAIALDDGGFLTDDITPVVFNDTLPCIMPLNRKVKIRKDTAQKLGLDLSRLSDAEKGTDKKYLAIDPAQKEPHPLNVIIRITAGPADFCEFTTPSASERFSMLRSEVCSWEILAGMPETEKSYMTQLVTIVEKTLFIDAVRSPDAGLREFSGAVRTEILRHGPRQV